jgi:hypothetical protein
MSSIHFNLLSEHIVRCVRSRGEKPLKIKYPSVLWTAPLKEGATSKRRYHGSHIGELREAVRGTAFNGISL